MSTTSVTIALNLAQNMAATKLPNEGVLQSDSAPGQSPIPAMNVVAVWISGMPESVLFPTMPAWDKDTTPGNQTDLVDPNAIGCSLAYISDYCKNYGGSLATVSAMVSAEPYLVLTTLPGAPSWDAFMQDMRNVGWATSNDPFNAFGVVWPAPTPIVGPFPC